MGGADTEGPQNPRRREFIEQTVVLGAAAALGLGVRQMLRKDGKRATIDKKSRLENMNQEGLEEKDDFHKQFENFSTLTIEGKDKSPDASTTIKITEINPPPDQVKNPQRLVFAQAWLHPLANYEYTLQQLYQDGRSTVTFDHPRVGGEFAELPSDELAAVAEVAKQAPEEIRSAQILLEVLAATKETQTDVLTHSRGLAYATVAALIDNVRAKKEGRENRIRNIVAYGPVGLIGEDSLIGPGGLAWRVRSEDKEQVNYGPNWGGEGITMEQLAEELSVERKEKARLGMLPPGTETDPTVVLKELESKKLAAEKRGIREYGPPNASEIAIAKEMTEETGDVGKDFAFGKLDSGGENRNLITRWVRGIPRSVREAVGISSLKLDEILPKLREIGVGVAIAHGTDDKVFPTERVSHYMKKLTGFGVLDISMTGVHDGINRDPRVAHILNGFFAELEKQRQPK